MQKANCRLKQNITASSKLYSRNINMICVIFHTKIKEPVLTTQQVFIFYSCLQFGPRVCQRSPSRPQVNGTKNLIHILFVMLCYVFIHYLVGFLTFKRFFNICGSRQIKSQPKNKTATSGLILSFCY